MKINPNSPDFKKILQEEAKRIKTIMILEDEKARIEDKLKESFFSKEDLKAKKAAKQDIKAAGHKFYEPGKHAFEKRKNIAKGLKHTIDMKENSNAEHAESEMFTETNKTNKELLFVYDPNGNEYDEFVWDDFKAEMRTLLGDNTEFYVEGSNMGWRHLSGHAEIEIKPGDVDAFIDKCMPKTSDFTVYVYKSEDPAALCNMKISHHDAPTGEHRTVYTKEAAIEKGLITQDEMEGKNPYMLNENTMLIGGSKEQLMKELPFVKKLWGRQGYKYITNAWPEMEKDNFKGKWGTAIKDGRKIIIYRPENRINWAGPGGVAGGGSK